MSDDDPASWGATPTASGDDPASWGAKPADSGFSWSRAITDIPQEIGQEAGSALTDIGNLSNRSEQGPIEGLMTTGKAALAVPRLLASPITGAARSLIGHPMANLEHKVGEYINPEVAAKDNPEQMYETAKGDVDTAMSAVRPAGAPIKVPGTPVTTAHPTVPGAQVTTTPRGTYEWNAPPATPKPTGVVDQPDTDAFFDAADQHYKNMRGYGVEIDKRAMSDLATNARNELEAEGYDEDIAPKTYARIKKLENIKGQNATISDIENVRKGLNKVRKTDYSESDAVRRVVGHIDDYLANLKNNPQDVVVNPHFAARVSEDAVAARANYAVASRSEDVDEALRKAETHASVHGDIGSAIQMQLKSLRNNPKKMMGWSDAEKEELDSAISGSNWQKATKRGAKFAPHGIVSTLGSVAAGHAVLPGAGEALVPAAGFVSKMVNKHLAQRAAANLSNVVKARSPLGKQTSINAAAQSALTPPASNPRLLSTGVAAGLPRPLPAINIRPLTAEGTDQNQNPTAGFARGGNVNHAHSSGEDHSGRAAAEKALPVNHKLGMVVPKGGSSCAKCKFLTSKTTCGNKGFVKWNGGATLPAPADQYCCDLYEKAKGFAHGGAVHNSHPTEAQKKAGNYAKTHKFFQGLDITIENLKGSNRSGVSKDGKSWSVKMPADYGYIKRTEGADGDHVDCYLGPNEKSDQVFVVDQKDDKTGRFDEHKCLLGFSNEREAKQHYLAGFSDGKNRIKHMRRMSMSEFREWLEKGDTSKEIHKYATGGAVRRAMDAGGATDFDTEWQDRAWPTYPETMHQMQRSKPDLYKALNSEASARREEETPRSFNDRFRPIHQMDIYNSGGAVNRAVRAAKGYADGGGPDDSYDPFAAEKFVNPEVSQAVGNLTQTSRPAPDPNDPVLYRTASPLVNITQGDIERGMNVGMSVGAGTIAGVSGTPKFNSLEELRNHWTDQGVRNYVGQHAATGNLQLADLVVPKEMRNSGIGSQFMQDLTGLADTQGRTVTLTPDKSYGASSVGRLKDFYKRFGFVENKGKNADYTISDSMYRQPKDVGTSGQVPEPAPKFYSALDQAVESLPLNKATGQQWLGTLTNKGVKGEEMEHRGVADFLAENANRPVTKEEVQNHLAGNKVELGEVEKGGNYNIENIRRLEAEREQVRNDLNDARRNNRNLTGPEREANIARMRQLGNRDEEIGHEIYSSPNTPDPTKFSSYQLPGGENYREKLLTLPENKRLSTLDDKLQSGQPMTEAERNERVGLENQAYRSSHWDEPNVLVHRRTNEREVNGVPSLHLEEIQSDWHQKGRKEGYNNQIKELPEGYTVEPTFLNGQRRYRVIGPQGYTAPEGYGDTAEQAVRNVLGRLNAGQVPDAPFKKNWHELALKDAIREAAEKGINRISWTPGEAQAARYDLSKQVSRVQYNPESGKLWGYDHHDNAVIDHRVSKDKLPDFVGKDVADKLLNSEPDKGWHTVSGTDLKVGGEGMKGFYDKMIPDAMNKIGKPHGVKVKEGKIPIQSGEKASYADVISNLGYTSEQWQALSQPERAAAMAKSKHAQPVWYMDIPESLKKEALHKGFKMFADGGAVTLPKPAKTGGRISYPAALKTAYAIKRASQ